MKQDEKCNNDDIFSQKSADSTINASMKLVNEKVSPDLSDSFTWALVKENGKVSISSLIEDYSNRH